MPRNAGRGTNFFVEGIRNNASGDDDNKCDGLNDSGAAFTPKAGDLALVEKTKQNTVEVMPNYRSRMMHIVRWLEEEYPDTFDKIVYELTEEEMNDPRYHYSISKKKMASHNIYWNHFTPDIMQTYLSGSMQYKDKEKNMKYTYDHLRKYHDAVLKCSEYSPPPHNKLPSSYAREMKPYLKNLKTELNKAKSDGKVAEKDADPICFALYEVLCQWAVSTGNIFVWVFLVLQWNLMARAANVDGISFSNFWSNGDSVVFKYDINKCDRTGEKTSEKHCYANPKNQFVCLFLAMGCYLSIFQQKFEKKDKNSGEKLFRSQGADRSASSSFSKALHKLVKSIKNYVSLLGSHSVRKDHFGPHGVRKGAATDVTTGSMEPPPIPSILQRGEWSLGKVWDVYIKFNAIGDTYLGRCLAGLLPSDKDFNILPPHFTVGMDNKHVNEAMKQCFGVILGRYGGHSGIEGALLLFLASIVYHHEWLKGHIARGKQHPFVQIPILNDKELLGELLKLVTLEPTAKMKPTGVPATIEIRNEVRAAVKLLHAYRKDLKDLKDNMVEMVKTAMEQKFTESGNITATFVQDTVTKIVNNATGPIIERMEESEKRLMSRLDEGSDCTQRGNRQVLPTADGALNEAPVYQNYTYSDPESTGRNKNNTDWVVPSHFGLQSSDLYEGFRSWLMGYPAESTTKKGMNSKGEEIEVIKPTPVRPLRLLKHGRMPHKFKKAYDNNYKPIMELLEEAVKSEVASRHVKDMDYDFVRETYDKAISAACAKYPILSEGVEKNWKVSTFCKNLSMAKTATNEANGVKRITKITKKRKRDDVGNNIATALC